MKKGYLILLLILLVIPSVSAVSYYGSNYGSFSDFASFLFGLDLDNNSAFLLVSLWIILFAVFFKVTSIFFSGNKTAAIIVSFIMPLIAFRFMDQNNIDFLKDVSVFVLIGGVIALVLSFLNMVGLKGSGWRKATLLIFSVCVIYIISRVNLNLFDTEYPLFGMYISLKQILYTAFVITIFFGLFFMRKSPEERRVDAEIKKLRAEERHLKRGG